MVAVIYIHEGHCKAVVGTRCAAEPSVPDYHAAVRNLVRWINVSFGAMRIAPLKDGRSASCRN